jgi:hypothetical protein
MFKHTQHGKMKIKVAVSAHWKTEDRRNKHFVAINKFKKEHGFFPMSSPVAREKISIASMKRTIQDKNITWKNCKRGYYLSIKSNRLEYYHSSYERNRMIELDEDINVKSWTKRHGIVIKYAPSNRYYPDFYIEFNNGMKMLEEIKGYVRDIAEFLKKSAAAKLYCDENEINYVVNFPKEMHKEKYKFLISMLW